MNHDSTARDLTEPLRRRLSPARRWLTRVVLEEDVFLFLLGARWFSLLPPAFALLWRPEVAPLPWALFFVAVAVNLALNMWHAALDRLVMRQPLFICVDMAFGAVLLALSGGAASPYFFYTLTPVLTAAFLSSSMRGGLLAAFWFTPFYAAGILWAQGRPHNLSDADLAFTRFCVLYGAAFVFGYQSLLLRRLRASAGELRRSQEELARAETLAALGKMVAHVSHEIRNPLSTLGGFANALARRPDDPEKVRHHAEIIASEITRLEELLNDLLDLSRPQNTSKSSGDLHEVLDRACLLAGDWAGHDIALRKDYDSSLPPFSMNASSLLRALLNVTRNALQAMPDGGSLTVSTCRAENEIVITIADTGKGIAADKLSTIWTPFVTHREHGTGLGLTVTQQIVLEHGGRVAVESQIEQGTSFVFHFPFEEIVEDYPIVTSVE